jgi:hypothetical protein
VTRRLRHIAAPTHVVVVVVAALVSGAACEPPIDPSPDGGPDPIVECFYGDESLDPEGELVFMDENFEMQDLVPAGPIPAILPPQGGKVILVGARVRNMDLCSLQANGGVFDDCQRPARIIGREGRGIAMDVNDAIGFGEPRDPDTLNNYVNIPLCPNFSSSRDIDGEPYRVEIRFSDRARRSLVLTADIAPYCAGVPGAPDGVFEQCECECDAEYSFDSVCEDIIIDDDRPSGICPAADGDPLPTCEPACDAGRVCAPSVADPAVGECL